MWQLIARVLLVVTFGFESSDREFESQAWPGTFSVILGSCSLRVV
jgi:hypothetical protein